MFKTLKLAAVVAAAALLPSASHAADQYVGADKCKSCHKEIHATMKAGPHAKAGESKDVAKDPAKCMKCHDTGAALTADQKGKSFKDGQGVQCESCHGPASKHVKARMADEGGAKVADDEIVKKPAEAVCVKCHNKESPTFKGFKFAEAAKKIEHKQPKK